MSLGADRPFNEITRAVKRAHDEEVILVAAAGNDGDGNILTSENAWPANNERVISVANVAKKDDLPTAKKSNSNVQIDYAGIGVKVNSFKPDGTFTELSGTSMASPHVCGLIAALMTTGGTYEDRTTNDTAVRALLNEEFAIDIGMKGVDNATGLGFLTYLSEEEFEDDFVELPDFEEE